MAKSKAPIIEMLTEAAAPHAKNLVLDALGKLVQQAHKDGDAFGKLALQMASDLVEQNGVEALEQFSAMLVDLLDGKDVKLDGLTAKQLTRLANEVQELEAQALRRKKRWARDLGHSAKRLSALLPQVLRGFML